MPEAAQLVLGKITTETHEGGSLHGRIIERRDIDAVLSDTLRDYQRVLEPVRYQIVNKVFYTLHGNSHGI